MKTISGRIRRNRWNLLTGKFWINDHVVYTGNWFRFFALRACKWACVKIGSRNEVVEILDAE